MPSKAFKLAEAMVSNPVMSDMVENPTATPTQIAAVETKTSAISDTGVISVNTKNIVSNNTLTQSFDSNQVVAFNLTDSIDAVSPIVSVFKEVPQQGFSSKGQWDVNANATNYDFFDEKPISYSSSTLTPSATGDGTFTSSTPTIIPNKFSLIPDFGTTQNTYATTGMNSYYINTSVSDGYSPQSSSVAVSPDGTKAIVLQWNTSSFGKQRLHSWNLQTAFGINSAYVWQAGTGYDPVNSQWLHQGYYDVTIGGTDVAHRHGHFGVDPSGVHFYFHRSTTTYYYKASTAWDVTTLSYQNKTFAPSGNGVPASNQNVQGAEISSNGSYLIYCSGNYVATYTMSTAFDVSTASSGSKQEVDVVSILTSAGLTVTGGLRSAMFNSDGTELLTNIHYSSHHHRAYKFTLSTAWDITTASYVQNSESSNGGYNLKFFEQSSSDNTWVSFTVDGSIDVAIVQLDEISQFNLNDVGKKVVGNSGSAIITATSGTYTSVTPFADTSAISSWQLFGAEGKSDGSGIELSGYSSGYDLSSPSNLKSWATAASPPEDIASAMLGSDGTKGFYLDTINDQVVYITLSTAFDISTATRQGAFNTQSSDTARGLYIFGDGTRVYTTSPADYIRRYDLSTAWDVSTVTYVNAFYQASQEAAMNGLEFKPDGTKMYICGTQNNTAYQYSLSTAWDITTASYDNKSLPVSDVGTSAMDLRFNSNGTKLFSMRNTGQILTYNLSTPWDISTGSYSSSETWVTGYTNVWGFSFANNGKKILISNYGANPDELVMYDTASTLHSYSQYSPALTNSSTGQINSSAWLDINSMTADETKNNGDIFYAVSTDNRTSWGVAKGSDGVRKIVKNNSGTWQYNNDGGSVVGYGLANETYDNKNLDTTANTSEEAETGIAVSSDGTKFYITGYQQDKVFQFDLSTPFDLSTGTYNNVSYTLTGLTHPWGLFFKPDGTKMYVLNPQNPATISEYALSTAWDVSTASHTATENYPAGPTYESYGLFFKSDGSKVYILRYNSTVYSWNLTTPWDITTGSYIGVTSAFLNSNSGRNILFNDDGLKMYLLLYDGSPNTYYIREYDLSTAWDPSTASYNNISFQPGLDLGGSSTTITAMCWANSGKKLYVTKSKSAGGSNYGANSFTTTTTGFGTSETWVNGTNNNEHATLQEALGAQAFNRMNKAQLDAVADGYHFSQDSADTLDLMIAPYAASGTSPISDGVTINYDAEALVREAVAGTDYVAEFPNSSTINIKSLVNTNMKVRAL
jgi:hypothetical protein